MEINTVKPRYTEVSGKASTIRYNETFGIARYLYITKLGLRSRNIRYNDNIFYSASLVKTVGRDFELLSSSSSSSSAGKREETISYVSVINCNIIRGR